MFGRVVRYQHEWFYGQVQRLLVEIVDDANNFPALFTCNDPSDYEEVLLNYVSADPNDETDCVSENFVLRQEIRTRISDGGQKSTVPQRILAQP